MYKVKNFKNNFKINTTEVKKTQEANSYMETYAITLILKGI